jgi:CHAT domain-containing protein
MPGSDEPRPMLAENEVVYEPSASLLSLLRRNEDKPKTDSKDLLIYSDPIFSADDPRSAGKPDDAPSGAADRGSYRFVDSLENLPRLKGSKLEAESVVEIINSSSVDAFAGASARRDNLLSSRLSDYKIIHFATHGLVDESHPELSGIVLSRFDEGRNQIDEMVRLQDIYSMDLNADLVVLSACGTGIGKDVKGEGLMSLHHAFLQVGAETVVSSMWKVEDTATLELMKEFYSGISDGQLSTSEALRRAQLKLLNSNRYRSPFYWAAFTMNGDFGSKPQLRHGRVYWPLLLLAVPAAIFAAMRLRKRRLVNKKTVVDG